MPDRLAEIRARLDAATPGPWRYISPWLFIEYDGEPWRNLITHKGNGRFIAHAPADIAWLLAEIERLSTADAD